MSMHIPILDHLTRFIGRLPGLGPRSARRLLLHLLKNPDSMRQLSELLNQAARETKKCTLCGNFDIISPCSICIDEGRTKEILCVVESVTELWAIERSRLYKGQYHILGGNLSAIDSRTPDTLNIASLKEKVVTQGIKEVILATNSTLEGQTTAHYLADLLMPYKVKVTKLAYGLPIGAELDYIDDGTLTIAFQLRQDF